MPLYFHISVAVLPHTVSMTNWLLSQSISFEDLRVNVSKNQRNRGHSSKFNFAHTLSIGRPKSHTYDKEVRLLKFSLVWEKST